MSEDSVATGSRDDVAASIQDLRRLLEKELAAARAQVAAASEGEGMIRAERDKLRHTQVSSEIRLMEMQKDLMTFVDKSVVRERECFEKEAAASKELASMRLELGRAADQLAMAQAIARNAQAEVVRYEAAQRAQIGRLGELEPHARELEQKLQTLSAKMVKEKSAYEAQARELIRKRKETEAKLTELAGARSRRILMKLRLVSRCAWEK